MATKGKGIELLRNFLGDAFSIPEFKMFLVMNDYREVDSHVSSGVGGTKYFFDVVQALDRRKKIDAEFFVRLKKARLKRKEEIRVIEELWTDTKTEELWTDTKTTEVNVVLIDDNPITRGYLGRILGREASVTIDGNNIICHFHEIKLALIRDSIRVDLDETLRKIEVYKPGVAVIDLRLEGDADRDYSGVSLSLKLREVFHDCSFVLVSHHFDEDSRFLDALKLFPFRVDRSRGGYGDVLRNEFKKALRQHVHALEAHLSQ